MTTQPLTDERLAELIEIFQAVLPQSFKYPVQARVASDVLVCIRGFIAMRDAGDALEAGADCTEAFATRNNDVECPTPNFRVHGMRYAAQLRALRGLVRT